MRKCYLLAIHANIISRRIGFAAQFSSLTVHPNSTGKDQLLRSAPGCITGASKDFL
jgi:hypothetical protein